MTATLTVRQRAARSTVAIKYTMAVTGLLMVLFLIGHMLGNLHIFEGQAKFDGYAHALRELGGDLVPESLLLWIARIGLIICVVAHIWSAIVLTRRDVKATGSSSKRYYSSKNKRGMQRTYASFTMRYGGIVIALFVIFHLLQFTILPLNGLGNPNFPGTFEPSPYDRVVAAFSVWWVYLIYVIAIIAVSLHLRHGIWSGLTTLGANVSDRARRNLNLAATIIAVVLFIGFLAGPTYIFIAHLMGTI